MKNEPIRENEYFVESAKVMAKGQITIPKDVREVLGVGPGNRVTFVVEGDSVRMYNAFHYALSNLQDALKGLGENAGLDSEEAINEYVKKIRDGEL